MIKFDDDGRWGVDVLQESLLASHRLALPIGHHRSFVYALGEIIEDVSHLAEHFHKMRFRNLSQVGTCVDAHEVHLLECLLAHAPKVFHGEMGDEVECLVGMDGADAIGLAIVGSHLGEKLAIADASRGGELRLLLDANLDFLGDVNG